MCVCVCACVQCAYRSVHLLVSLLLLLFTAPAHSLWQEDHKTVSYFKIHENESKGLLLLPYLYLCVFRSNDTPVVYLIIPNL